MSEMKTIKYWEVRLFQHIQMSSLVSGSGLQKHLVFEGYSKGKPAFYPGAQFTIELLTSPDGVESQTIRTCGIDSMICTPVYDEAEKAPECTDEGLSPGCRCKASPIKSPIEQMWDYVKCAILEGYEPDNQLISSGVGVTNEELICEHGKAWLWYCARKDEEAPKLRSSFEKAAEPLIKWMAENVHPHHTATVTATNAVLSEMHMCYPTDKFLKD